MNKCRGQSKNGPCLICFADSDWWYHNRGLFAAQVMPRIAKHYKVLFVNSLGFRVPSLKRDRSALKKIARKLRSMLRLLRRTKEGMYVFSPLCLPVFDRPVSGALWRFLLLLQIRICMLVLGMKKPILYIGCPTAWEVVKQLRWDCLVYQKTDVFEEAPGGNQPYIRALDEALTTNADLILYVNSALCREGEAKNKNCQLVGHGVDFDLFARAEREEYVPEDIRSISRPIVGFFGDITDDVCDFELITRVAEALPHASVVMVGPVSSDVSNLKQCSNIFFLGQKPYDEIPHYGKMFDVAIMPWKKNRWIEFCNPIKTKEYLALGKPIVSTWYPELAPYVDVVYAAHEHDEFVEMVGKALVEDEPDMRDKRRRVVQDETWDKKVEQIVLAMEKLTANT